MWTNIYEISRQCEDLFIVFNGVGGQKVDSFGASDFFGECPKNLRQFVKTIIYPYSSVKFG